MPATGTRTSSSRIVVSGSLRADGRAPLRRRRVAAAGRRVRSRSRPRRRRLRRLPPSPSSPLLVLLLVALLAGRPAGRPAGPAGRGPAVGPAVLVWSCGPASRSSRAWSCCVLRLCCRLCCRSASWPPCCSAWPLGSSASALLVLRGGRRRPVARVWRRPAALGRSWLAAFVAVCVARLRPARPLRLGTGLCRRDWPRRLGGLDGVDQLGLLHRAGAAMPRPPAICFSSASSMELSPPPRFLAGPSRRASGVEADSMVSVT